MSAARPQANRIVRHVRRAASCALTAILIGSFAACGGGGGLIPAPVASGPVDGRVSATFEPNAITGSIVEGEAVSARYRFRGNVSYTGNRDIYLGLNSSDGLARDYGIVINGSSFDGDLAFNVAYPPGTQRGELILLVCFDVNCRATVPGSPMKLPLQLDVLPNLQVAPETTLVRAGNEPAPTLDIPVSVPAAAGEVVMDAGFDTPALSVQWLGNALRVTTEQLPAGSYAKDVVLASRSDPRYRTSTRIVYRVDPPPGGQLPLGLTPGGGFVLLEQGQTYRQRLRLQRPTWTSALQAAVLTDASGRARLAPLGGDEYELSFDGTNLEIGSVYQPEVSVSALPWGGQTVASFRLEIGSAFGVGLPGVTLDGSSTAASLSSSGAVTTATAPAARWSARSLTPWVRLRSSSGTTGADALTVDFDAATVLAQRGYQEGTVEVSIDRPGTLPARVPVAVLNRIPALGPTFTAALLPGNGRVYLDGVLDIYGGITSTLQVDAATLQGATVRSDSRFFGDLSVMQVDLQGLTAGQTVTLRSVWPLLTSEVRIPVLNVPRVSSGQVTLPLRRWHSAQYSLRQNALYFAGDGVVGRWSLTGGVWSLQTADVPGLWDAALHGDDGGLLASGAETIWRLDAGTLAVTASGSLPSAPFYGSLSLEPTPPATMSSLAVAADGAPLAAIRVPPAAGTGVAMMTVGGQFASLTGSSANGTDPGTAGLAADPGSGRPGVGLVRSPNGEFVVGVYPTGQLRVYQASQRVPAFSGQIPAGRSLRAVSDDGSRLLLDNGSLTINGTAVTGSLSALVPAGFAAGGYGLSGNGRFGLIYLYREAIESGLPRARDAALWTVDLSAMTTTGLTAGTPVVGRHALADAVGCNGALQGAESCTHEAQVVVAPGDGSAFVLGPRGVAALPLPATVSAARAVGPRRNALRGFVPGGHVQPAARSQ